MSESRQKVACVDFDGVLAYYDKWRGEEHIGEPLVEGIKLVRMLNECGVKVLIHTCRNSEDMNKKTGVSTEAMNARIISWLVDQEISFCELYTGCGKPFADVYIDDRAVYFEANQAMAYNVFCRASRILWPQSLNDYGN